MKTNVISVKEALENGTWNWERQENDIEFKGIIPGYVCGWCVEVKRDGEINYCSTTFSNDYEEFRFPEDENGNLCPYNDIGLSAAMAMDNGWEPTGNIVFRGYFKSVWDSYYNEEGYVEASQEVE